MVALRFLPAVLWAGVIFWLSSQPDLPGPDVSIPGLDKVLHAGAFGLLTALLLWGDRGPSGRRAWVWAVVAAAYGVTDEIHQSFVPTRSVEFLDGVADAVGACIVVWIWLYFRARRLAEGGAP